MTELLDFTLYSPVALCLGTCLNSNRQGHTLTATEALVALGRYAAGLKSEQNWIDADGHCVAWCRQLKDTPENWGGMLGRYAAGMKLVPHPHKNQKECYMKRGAKVKVAI